MKTAVVLNDTSQRNHHGCMRVMQNLIQGLASQGISVIGSSLAHTDWSKDRSFLAALDRCDVIVINGEGTIHHGAPAGRRLLGILDAPSRRGRPAVLINALWQKNPLEWAALLDRCDIVALRDYQSASELSAAGFRRTRVLPDLSLCGPAPAPIPARHGEVVGDSVRIEARRVLASAAQARSALYMPTKTLHSPIWRLPVVSALLWRIYNGTFHGTVPDFQMAANEAIYLQTLQGATGHLTGRFHGICLSMIALTPFLALASTTSKIQSLLIDAGLGLDRMREQRALAANPREPIPPFSETELTAIHAFRNRADTEYAFLFADIRSLI